MTLELNTFADVERALLLSVVASKARAVTDQSVDTIALDMALGELMIACQEVRDHIDAEWRGLRAAQTPHRPSPPTLDELA